jgi:2-polyprenyl-3-methyl-5-hydroxy-6-metoxy-1,4-benzoquinol methylase
MDLPMLQPPRVDKEAYDTFYVDHLSALADTRSPADYAERYRGERIVPFYAGGTTKGFVRGLATRMLIEEADRLGRPRSEIRVLDAGCGAGELSVYLAAGGFQVSAVDLSTSGCAMGSELARRVGVADRCTFKVESLGELSLPGEHIDFVIGHGALHHFIKYREIPGEFKRVMKPGARGFFADGFGENRAYHLFHDKQRMARLGDVILNRDLVRRYFEGFEVELIPTDWFVMLDKLYARVCPSSLEPALRRVSRVHFALDRLVPSRSSAALFLSGAVVVRIRKV